MASVTLYGPEEAAVVRWLPEVYVRTKAAWTDAWEWAPRLRPVGAVEQAGAGNAASFELYHGELIEHGDLDWSVYPYEAYRGRFVDVIAWDGFGDARLWCGLIPDEDHELWGREDVDSGKTVLRALGFDYLLRVEILEFRTEVGWVFRPLTFNAHGRRGWTLEGNRSTDACSDGYYLFSGDGEMWTNRDIVELLLKAYTPSNLDFVLTGEVDALDQIEDVHNLYRMRVSDALDRLIDRRRGLGWVLRPSLEDGGPIEVHVYSTLAETVAVGAFTAPANNDQAVVDWTGSHDLTTTARFSEIDRYKKIIVLGGPVYSTFTLSWWGGGLEQGWTVALETAYKMGFGSTAQESDQRRADPIYDRVYRYFRVPDSWDWVADNATAITAAALAGESHAGTLETSAAPGCDENGQLRYDLPGVVWRKGLVFERWLPWEEEGSEAGDPDYQQPFAFIKDEEDTWQLCHRLLVAEEEYFMRMSLADRELAVRFDGKRGHVMGLNWFVGGETTMDPVVDFRHLGVTVQVALDERLRVIVEVPEAAGANVKTIEMPEAVAWYVAPGTVEKVQAGALVEADSGLVRDDSDRLRAVAALAKAWYGTPRSTLELLIDKQLAIAHPVGQLVKAAVGAVSEIDVGTVVTRREWDFREFRTRIQTGFDELRFSDFPGVGPGVRGRRGRKP